MDVLCSILGGFYSFSRVCVRETNTNAIESVVNSSSSIVISCLRLIQEEYIGLFVPTIRVPYGAILRLARHVDAARAWHGDTILGDNRRTAY